MSIFTDLDLGEPVALVLLAVLHFITDRTGRPSSSTS
jgi:hypothetical protein